MSIYHLSTNVHSRGKGHSAVRASAYRSGEIVHDDRLGVTYDFTQYRKSHGECLVSEIFLPEGADKKYLDRETLWNGAEDAERTKAGEYKKTSVISRDIECALPFEMSDKEREHFAKEHAKYLVLRYGCAVDMNIHAPHPDGNQKNYHVHYLLTTRKLDKDGFGAQCELELNGKVKKELGFATGKNQLKEMRESWANHLNKALERGGHTERVDHRSYEAQGIEKIPSVHMGVEATEMERRGDESRLGDKNKEIKEKNQTLEQLKAERKVIDLEIEREKRKNREKVLTSAKQQRRKNIQERIKRNQAKTSLLIEKAQEKRANKTKSTPKQTSFTLPSESQQQRTKARYALEARQKEEFYEFETKMAHQKSTQQDKLNAFYKPAEHKRKLRETQRDLENHQGIFSKVTGKTKALKQDVADLKRNLESLEQTRAQTMSLFKNRVSQERQRLTQRHQQELTAFDRQPIQKTGTAKAFEKEVLKKEVANQNPQQRKTPTPEKEKGSVNPTFEKAVLREGTSPANNNTKTKKKSRTRSRSKGREL